MPVRLRCDNGVPFATIVLGCPSALRVWWVRLGVLPDPIDPSAPQQNGRHERMPRTLKAEATRPAAATMVAQQGILDRSRREYNAERPHEALGPVVPASRYAPSQSPHPARLPPVEYPARWEVRRVSRNGGMRWYSVAARRAQRHGVPGPRTTRTRRAGRSGRSTPRPAPTSTHTRLAACSGSRPMAEPALRGPPRRGARARAPKAGDTRARRGVCGGTGSTCAPVRRGAA